MDTIVLVVVLIALYWIGKVLKPITDVLWHILAIVATGVAWVLRWIDECNRKKDPS